MGIHHMITVRALEEAQSGAPLLRQLRSGLDDATFNDRLKRAVAQGYRNMGAFEDDTLIGVLGYRMTDDLCWGRTLYVDDLVVDVAQRGRGVGASLLSEARRIAQTECDHIRLCSGLNRTSAHVFYERVGLTRSSFQFVAAI